MNPTRMDEWKRETNLEVLTFDYLQPPKLNACCFCWWRLSRARESVDIGREEKKRKKACCSALVQQARARERESSMKKDEKDSLSSHPHYVNEVHDCSVGPSRVNYQWLLSLIG